MDADKQLCYLAADHLEGPLASFNHLDVKTFENEPLGHLDGIVFDRPNKRMRYFVVDSGDQLHHRYLLPLCPTRIDADEHALQVDVDDRELRGCEEFKPEAFHTISDEELRKVVFYTPAEEIA